MRYRAVVPKKIQKIIDGLERLQRDRIVASIAILETNPYLGKKLTGNRKEQWSYRVWPFRIVYEIEQRELIIMIVKVGHRKDAIANFFS